MRRTLATTLALVALPALWGQSDASGASSAKEDAAAPAYLRNGQEQASEPLESVSEALPSSLNGDFADKSTQSPKLDAEEITETDLVLQRERENWLTVGVQKLSGDYQPEADLSAEELEELEEKRASYYSPTMFVDHFARINEAQQTDNPGSQALKWDLQADGAEPLFQREKDFYTGWPQTQAGKLLPQPTPSRENPYLSSLNVDSARSNNVYMATSQRTEATTVRIPEARSPLSAPTRERPLAQSSTPSMTLDTGSLATPAPQPASAPSQESPLRREDISEKYFRNLDRF